MTGLPRVKLARPASGAGRAPRSRGRASGGTGQATVRTRAPPDRTWATGPSSR